MPDPAPDFKQIDSLARQDKALLPEFAVAEVEVEVVSPITSIFGKIFECISLGARGNSHKNVNLGESLEDAKNRFQRRKYEADGDYLDLQKSFAERLYLLVVGWLCVVLVAIFGAGFGYIAWWKFQLSDKVLITFITSTTANVIGLFLLVAQWLFKSSKQRSEYPVNDPKPVTSRGRKKKDPLDSTPS